MRDYYNEFDPYAAQFLRNLIDAGEIPSGDVDTRDIRDVRPADLDGYRRVHFFAGCGVWAAALERAAWPADLPVWTGSCPCQPFSAAGAGAGFDDERHLWPHWHWLIEQCRPETVLGEQVASADGLGWLDLVSSDMEATGYALGAVDTCAAGFGSYHIRQRLYFAAIAEKRVVNTTSARFDGRRSGQAILEPAATERAAGRSDVDGLADASSARPQGQRRNVTDSDEPGRLDARPDGSAGAQGVLGGLADATSVGRGEERAHSGGVNARNGAQGRAAGHDAGGNAGGLADASGQHFRAGPGKGTSSTRQIEKTAREREWRWADDSGCSPVVRMADAGRSRPSDTGRDAADWLFCRDGKWRPVEPGTFPLAHEVAARVGRLRAYGNALDLGQATAFCRAVLERDMAERRANDLFEWSA